MTTRIMSPLQDSLGQIGYGALGGYVGSWAVARWNGIEGIQPLGRYQIESAVAGGLTEYIWIFFKGVNADVGTVWKPMLVGFLGEWLYNRFVRGTLVEMNVIS
jgi:hypothetical protein